MEKIIFAFKVFALVGGIGSMVHRIVTARKDSEVQRLSKDVNALMFFVSYLVLATLTTK